MKQFFCTLTLIFSVGAFAKPLMIINAQGYTLTNAGALMQFSHMLINDGKVQALGDQSLLAQHPSVATHDLNGKVLIPGLIDAHGHLLGLGATLLQVDVRDDKSAQATAKHVRKYQLSNPDLSWITGRGWNQVLWPGKAFPTANQLDEYVTDVPVWLERVDGHAGWANSKALAIANITKDSIDPPGGKILRDENGHPTGVLIDTAMSLLEKHIPKGGAEFYNNSLNAVTEHLLALGITSMHDAGIDHTTYQFYQERAKNQTLGVRVYAMLSAIDPMLTTMLEAGPIHDPKGFLSIRSVKAYGDGALGSRGAALFKDYSDAPGNRGLLITQENQLKPLFDLVLGHEFQLNFHAIGDRANRLALDQFEQTFEAIGGQSLRHRIEHAQVINVKDIPRFKTLNIIPAMQPTHATSDMNMAEDRVGKKRLAGAYAWQTFIKQGTPIALGSDFPVELANPFYGLHAAVTRQNRNNQPDNGWIADEALTLQQAFKGFTIDAAYAAHQESALGGLTEGKWADFIIIDRDMFTIPAQDLWKVQVLETWMAGKQVYKQ